MYRVERRLVANLFNQWYDVFTRVLHFAYPIRFNNTVEEK